MNPNDHSATRKIHKCNFYIDKTRATIYSLQCPTEANEKFQSSLIHITWNWIPPHLKFSNRPSIFYASTPKLASALRLLSRTCPFLALMRMQEPTNQGHQTLIIGHVRMYQEYGTHSKSKTNTLNQYSCTANTSIPRVQVTSLHPKLSWGYGLLPLN